MARGGRAASISLSPRGIAPTIDNQLVLAAQPEVAHQRTEIELLRIGEAII